MSTHGMYDWRWNPKLMVIELHEGFRRDPVRYDRESLVIALENTKKYRSSFATEEAWSYQMQKFEHGLAAFDAYAMPAKEVASGPKV